MRGVTQMKEIIIKLNSINDVKDFVNEAVSCPCEIFLVSGRYIIDGKSIMGVFSLDLSKSIKVEVNGEGAEEFIAKIAKFAE